MTLLRGRSASRLIQEETPAGNNQILRMLFREAAQEAPGLGEDIFPPLPEPLRPIGTSQGQAPANRIRSPAGDRISGSQGTEGEAAALGAKPLGSTEKPKGTVRRASPVSQSKVDQAAKRTKRDIVVSGGLE
eukprot:6689482-Heterocapsa_arctica.AAC.1